MNRSGEKTLNGTRCLLLVPHPVDAPLDLLDALRARNVRVCETSDPPAVMARMAREHFHALVIVEPNMLIDHEALCQSVGEYHPETAVWRYDADEHPRLQRCAGSSGDGCIQRPDPAVQTASPSEIRETDPAGQTYETSDNGDRDTEPAHPEHAEPPRDTGPLLSDEELAMLLDDPEIDESDHRT